jgi:3-oxoacyl-[acyl-carrier protein] reductase
MSKKTVLITGGSRGIGREIARNFAGPDVNIAITYYRNQEAAQSVIDELRQSGAEAQAFYCDLVKLESVDAAYQQIIATFEAVDILVNNAGATKITPFLEITLEEWEELINLNLRSSFFFAQKCAKSMRDNGWGRIINIGSLGGERLVPGISAHYAAGKAGLSGLTRVIAKELARYNILVNCVAPGLIETDLSGYMNSRNLAKFKEFHPLKRMGSTREVSEMVVFLASEKASYITGETFLISGGLA